VGLQPGERGAETLPSLLLESPRVAATPLSYNCIMARGWESKSVEAQIEESISEPSHHENRPASAEEVQSNNKKTHLILSRKHLLQQLERSTSERYSELLRKTLADLDAQIAAL